MFRLRKRVGLQICKHHEPTVSDESSLDKKSPFSRNPSRKTKKPTEVVHTPENDLFTIDRVGSHSVKSGWLNTRKFGLNTPKVGLSVGWVKHENIENESGVSGGWGTPKNIEKPIGRSRRRKVVHNDSPPQSEHEEQIISASQDQRGKHLWI